MTTTRSHHDNVEKQFGSQASAYLSSAVHASGRVLVRLGERLAAFPQAHVLDLGCGAGHASFTAAQQVAHVTAYDLSSQMLDVVAGAAKAKGLNYIDTRQGYAESLPFDDASFEVVISRYSAHHWHDVGQALREVKRVLKPGGVLLVGFDNGFNYLFDEDETVIKYTLPYNPLKDEALYREAMDLDFGVQFSHTLDEEIGGQLRAGFMLTDIYEDTSGEGFLHEHGVPCFVATRCVKK